MSKTDWCKDRGVSVSTLYRWLGMLNNDGKESNPDALSTSERNRYVRIARELLYSQHVINKLKEAETEHECEKILHDARKGVLR